MLPLGACADQPPARVGRKAAVLGWADAHGLATPGGVVVAASRFWAALEAAGAAERARYLQRAALRLDPHHTLTIAASVVDALGAPTVAAMARADAAAAFARLGAPPLVCRSSAAMEDDGAAAFPGVFASVLGIESPAALADAITGCWRSAFSEHAMRYLLRVGPATVDLSLALLLQHQVEAPWYGVYASVDPLNGVADPIADLSSGEPDALVGGAPATHRAQRRSGRWVGVDPALAASLAAVHEAARTLAGKLGAEVDVEFALPAGGPAVILQCRPLTRVADAPAGVERPHGPGTILRGRPCAAGRVTGQAAVPAPVASRGAIAVVHRLTAADYGIVLHHRAVVVEQDVSALSHVAILCRELGVPLVGGVEGAVARLAGRLVVVDGGAGDLAVLAGEVESAPLRPPPPPAEAVITAVEVLLLVLAEGRPPHAPLAEARRILRRRARALGAGPVRVTGGTPGPGERAELDRLGSARFGPAFDGARLLAELLPRRTQAVTRGAH